MAREQVSKSEQIMPNMSMVLDYDQPLTSSQDILRAFKNALGDNCFIEKYQKTKTIYSYKHDGITEYFLTGSITYLSNPHPLFKKRYQLKLWHKDFYNEHKNLANEKVHLIGIYHYEGLVVFVEFPIRVDKALADGNESLTFKLLSIIYFFIKVISNIRDSISVFVTIYSNVSISLTSINVFPV